MVATGDPAAPSADDDKLLTLARSARARTGAPEGAAVRDDIGRTYVASSVELPSLRLSAVQAVVAAAVSSGSDRLQAAAVVTAADALSDADRAVLTDVAVASVLLAGPDGIVRTT